MSYSIEYAREVYKEPAEKGGDANYLLLIKQGDNNCLTGDFAPSTATTQAHIMELTLGYLNIYFDLWQKDESADPAYMKSLIRRREAIRLNFQDKDPGNIMMEHAVGMELADLGLKAIF